jgi:hypothetical protein
MPDTMSFFFYVLSQIFALPAYPDLETGISLFRLKVNSLNFFRLDKRFF